MNYNQHLKRIQEEARIKVRTADLRRQQYDPAWIYLNRIGAKVRILTEADAIHNGGTIRNAIKITWDPDTYTRAQMIAHVRRELKGLEYFATHGTCQQCIRCSEVATVLCGGIERKPRTWSLRPPQDVDANATRRRILGIE